MTSFDRLLHGFCKSKRIAVTIASRPTHTFFFYCLACHSTTKGSFDWSVYRVFKNVETRVGGKEKRFGIRFPIIQTEQVCRVLCSRYSNGLSAQMSTGRIWKPSGQTDRIIDQPRPSDCELCPLVAQAEPNAPDWTLMKRRRPIDIHRRPYTFAITVLVKENGYQPQLWAASSYWCLFKVDTVGRRSTFN